MSDRDDELEKMLDHLRNNKIDELKIKRWQSAVRKELSLSVKHFGWANFIQKVMPMTAAFIIGIFVGVFAINAKYHGQPKSQQEVINYSSSATHHYIFAKAE